MFINVKSEYSFLSSLIKIDDYIDEGIRRKSDYLAISDINTTRGLNKFYNKCIKNNIKPILGAEFISKEQSYIIYAKNEKGVKRLYELDYQFASSSEIIFQKNEPDLILILGDGKLRYRLNKDNNIEDIKSLDKTFNNNFYMGYNSYDQSSLNFNFYKVLKRGDYKGIVTDEKNFLYESDLSAFINLSAIKENRTVNSLRKYNSLIMNRCLGRSGDGEKFEQNQLQLINSIDIDLSKNISKKPIYPFLSAGITDDQQLEKIAKLGLNKRLSGNIGAEYLNRLTYELQVIKNLEFSSYFLIVWDIVKFAKKENIYVGPGRGSAAGSLVSYCMGITDIDPVKNNLLFERFLNPKRANMPDIDLDFEDSSRNEIVDYVVQHYGKDHVCKIGTISRFLAKSVFRDVAKVNGVSKDKIDFMSKLFNSNLSISENLKTNNKLQKEILVDTILTNLIDICIKIEGLPRQSSIHAAGVIISPKNILNYTSLTDNNVSLLEAYELEEMGLLKIDILSLSNLTFIHKIVDEIRFKEPDFDIRKIPLNDQNTFDLLSSAKTLGIFQLESEGMRETLKIIKPQSFEEIAIALALYRPGPKDSISLYNKKKKEFVNRNAVDEVLKDTYGIIIYQEQIMLLSNVIAGYDYSQADILRRAISKKNGEQLLSIEKDFIKRGMSNGYKEEFVVSTYEEIKKFANYGFNKAHAFGYAKVAYQMAYLKANYPLIFSAEIFFNTYKSDKKKMLLSELKQEGIKVVHPNLLYSCQEINVDVGCLHMGFNLIESIGPETSSAIIFNRHKIKNPNDLVELISVVLQPSNVNATQIKNLVHAGCFDYLKKERRTVELNLLKLMETDMINMMDFGGSFDIIERSEYPIEELSRLEFESLGSNIKYDLFEKNLKGFIEKFKMRITTIDKVLEYKATGKFNCLVKVESLKVINTTKGEPMCFINGYSESKCGITVFPGTYQKYLDIIKNCENKYLVMNLKISKEDVILDLIY